MSLAANLVGGDGRNLLPGMAVGPAGGCRNRPFERCSRRPDHVEYRTRDRAGDRAGTWTGVFTRALLARGVEPRQLLMIERSAAFTLLLRRHFPGADVVCARAEELARPARDD